jgi:multiple sugar transport system substrate-binding protein
MAIVAVACGSDSKASVTSAAPAASGAPASAAPADTNAPDATTGASATTAAGGTAACGAVGDKGAIEVFLIPSPSSTSIQSFIPAFEKQTCVKVNFSETPYGEAHQKQLLAYQQGDGQFDVAQFDNTFLAPFGAAKAMTPLDDFLSKSTEYDIADFSKGQQDYGKYDGKTLGLTLSTEPMIQWYRTDIYDALGLKPATTWDQYLANAKAVKESGKGDGVLMGFGPNVSWWFMTLVWSFGGHLYDDSLKPTVNTPEAVKATEYLKSLLQYAPEGAISANGDDVMFKFLGQDIGAVLNYSGYFGATLDPAANKYQGKIGTAPMPKGTADITHLAGWNIGIPADSKNKDNAWKFLEFVLGKSNAKAYLASGAAAIGRTSITSDTALVDKQPYLQLLTIPASSRIERYPQLKVWPEMDTTITQALTAILSNQTEVQSGLDKLNADLGPILAGEKG